MTDPAPPRLSATTVPAGAAPPYERTTPPAVVHLGVGAFARAHLGAYADELWRAGHPTAVHGVSLRSPAAEARLAPQDGLYTVNEREPGQDGQPVVLGAFTRVGTGPDRAAAAIAAPSTIAVTLTVTEKGYEPDAAPSVVVDGLAQRGPDLPPPVVLPLDNLADNGAVLRARVLEVARARDAGLARWIEEQVVFPSSVVDRIVPATTPADLDEVAVRLGLQDEAAVVAERHRSWIVEQHEGGPPFHLVGAEQVEDVGPYQRRKLWLLNLPHSALAYAGLLAGCDTIAEAAAHPVVAAFAADVARDAVDLVAAPDAEAYAAASARRFLNPALGHTCRQVGADGSQKLLQRLVPVAEARRERGLPNERLALVAALWSAAVDGVALAGRTLPAVEDRTDRLIGATPELLDEVGRARRALERGGIDVLADLT